MRTPLSITGFGGRRHAPILLAGLLTSLLLPRPAGAQPSPSGRTIEVRRGGGREALAEAVREAKAGEAIALPEGTFPGGVALPTGVTLRGAGYRKTTLDAKGAEVGVLLKGGRGAEVTDITVVGAVGTGILVSEAEDVAIRRVRVIGCLDGIRLSKATRSRVENAAVADNRYGIIVGEGEGNVVVNCTLARNAGIGLSFPAGDGASAFNNAVVGSATGVYVGESMQGLKLDHNLTFNLYTGKVAGQTGRKMLTDWQYLTGLDAHSVRLPLTFRDADAGDFLPAGSLDWALDRAPTSEWGAARLGDVEAPTKDIDGQPRQGEPDVGAFEFRPKPPRPPDGSVTIRGDRGIKSAGIFTRAGREVAYLFHNLPLRPGAHPFWFPARDFQGRPIPTGSYDVRTVESDLEWKYLAWVGDTGAASPPSRTASVGLTNVAFDDAGRLFAGQGWSEDATNLRAFDPKGEIIWTFQGHAESHGLAVGEDGTVAILRPSKDREELTRLDASTGKVAPRDGRLLLDVPADVAGMAVLGETIFLADRKAGRVRFGPVGSPSPSGVAEVAAPSSPSADRKTKVVWLISGNRSLVALGPDGRRVAEVRPVEAPAAVAARDGRLAVASRSTGKVHLFDASDPNKLEPSATIGTGDGPYGPYLPDRFLFQANPESHVALAIGPKETLAVVDQNRLLVFDLAGTPLWSTFGVFGNATSPDHADPTRIYDTKGVRSLRLDEASGAWSPDAYLDVPKLGQDVHFLGTFAEAGRTFGLFLAARPGFPGPDLVVARFEEFRARPILGFVRDDPKGAYVRRKDKNGDGRLTSEDGGEQLIGPDGRRFIGQLFARFNSMRPDGSLLICDPAADHWLTYWACEGLDRDGLPIYRMEGRYPLRRNPKVPWISPYTHRPEDMPGFYLADRDDRGDVVANILIRSSPSGTGLSNTSGTDLAAFTKAGDLRWVHTLGDRGGLEGVSSVDGVTITGVATTAEIVAVDRDGLGLGGFSPPARVRYEGYFLDHPEAVRLYRGHDRRTYALLADNYSGRHHWFRLVGNDAIARSSTPVTLPEATARSLASRRDTPPTLAARPAPPVVRIPRLKAPMAIDGDSAKWRRAGVAPQVIITPETSHGSIDGPRDCSAVVRLAYQGRDLYAQFLVFDDVVSFHQPTEKHHAQDGVELCLNGFLQGFKFDATTVTDGGPTILRNRFYFAKLTKPLDPGLAPRVIRVLDDARDVPERELIEVVYGVDMAKCRVTITEFRLPIDETTYEGGPEALKAISPLAPGLTFWLGFLINDNDEAGTDVQDYLVWPTTYGNFNPVEDGARAILE